MNTHVESELTHLPEPVPPATLVTTVMARVSLLDEEPASASLAYRASKENSREGGVRDLNDLPVWVAAFAGLAIVVVSWITGGQEAGSLLDLMSSRIGPPNLLRMSPNGSAVLWLALGLLLYLAGLFSPLRDRESAHRARMNTRRAGRE
ncbi:MAG: hypothetical protein NTV05_15790 [Acidobacteria bacterium]|nr:hypothetical protein [Acidobacteriota bacterium]